MSKKIFRSVWLAALVVLALSLVLIMGVLYSYLPACSKSSFAPAPKPLRRA